MLMPSWSGTGSLVSALLASTSSISVLLPLWIEHYVLLLVRVVACHDGDGRLGVAEIEGLVWHVRRDENEISGDIHNAFLQSLAVASLDAALQQIDRQATPAYSPFACG